jgi:Holliday junction DNA helicase RuvA
VIAHLRGILLRKRLDYLVVETNGVGYRVEVPLSTFGRVGDVGNEVSLFIHTRVREDAIRLFGFDEMDSLRLFERLLKVSGVGPRLAVSALSLMTPVELHRAIIAGDVRQLSKISGVGKRTAERMIVDLGQSLRKFVLSDDGTAAGTVSTTQSVSDLEDALQYLGYKERDIRRTVQTLTATITPGTSIEALLKEALKLLQ